MHAINGILFFVLSDLFWCMAREWNTHRVKKDWVLWHLMMRRVGKVSGGKVKGLSMTRIWCSLESPVSWYRLLLLTGSFNLISFILDLKKIGAVITIFQLYKWCLFIVLNIFNQLFWKINHIFFFFLFKHGFYFFRLFMG